MVHEVAEGALQGQGFGGAGAGGLDGAGVLVAQGVRVGSGLASMARTDTGSGLAPRRLGAPRAFTLAQTALGHSGDNRPSRAERIAGTQRIRLTRRTPTREATAPGPGF